MNIEAETEVCFGFCIYMSSGVAVEFPRFSVFSGSNRNSCSEKQVSSKRY